MCSQSAGAPLETLGLLGQPVAGVDCLGHSAVLASKECVLLADSHQEFAPALASSLFANLDISLHPKIYPDVGIEMSKSA